MCRAVIVVDDVVTTGATLLCAAKRLTRDGYLLIICIAPSHKS
jgi:predicted amidophosphoribosyltransferase